MSYNEKVKAIYEETKKRIEDIHIACFKDMDKPLFLISNQYPGLWLEHVYDSLMYAKLNPDKVFAAKNAVNLFIDMQKENGQIPFGVFDGNKHPSGVTSAGFGQIQECVSFYTLCLEVYEMNKDKVFLEKAFESGKKWINWLENSRMTTKRGLIEMFVGFDTGHDNSGRLEGMSCKGNNRIDGVTQNASVLPLNDDVAPILAVDMNCNFYGNLTSLSKMAYLLNREDEAVYFENYAKNVKEKLFLHCFDEKDAFFYDVDKNGNKRRYKSSTIFHLFIEKVLDKKDDKDLIERIYKEHIKNPKEFWTGYPFPSMAINDPSCEGHKDFNCWGYYTQGLIVLRCSRWMDYYGWGEDYDYILSQWVKTWTEHFDSIKLAQEIDPVTGIPTKSSEWYSSCMLNYIYGAERLKLV